MWTNENRARYDRSKLRYPSDMTDVEWGFVGPLIPPARRGGGKRTVNIREVINGLMYVLSTGCQWRAIPKDFPPKNTVYRYFDLWTYDGTLERIHDALYGQVSGSRRTRGHCDSRSHRQTIRLISVTHFGRVISPTQLVADLPKNAVTIRAIFHELPVPIDGASVK